jgi:AraC family transcriptional regulator
MAAGRPGEDLSLKALAAGAGISHFHLHRTFVAVAGETPKAYTLRLRLSLAAVMLLTTGRSVLDIALRCGFQSHEVFSRAFARHFQMTPRAYRRRGFATRLEAGGAAAHAAAVRHAAPCLRLFHMHSSGHWLRTDMTYDIVKKNLDAQPVLVTRRRVKRSEIGAAIGEALPHIFMYAQQHGIALAGHPLTRYVEVGAGLLTIEPAMRIVSDQRSAASRASSQESAVIEDVLPAGPAATTVHQGPYETLSEAYAALETWMESNALQPAGPPWEDYITDPAEFPDPKDWRTEVCWPVAPRR